MIKNLLSFAAVAALAVSSANAAESTVWTGEQVFTGWSDNITVPASDVNFVSDGDKVIVYFSEVLADASIGIKTNVDGWPELTGTSFKNPEAGAAKAEWELGADAAAELKATGLIVQGLNMSVSSIAIASSADIDPNVLWEGNYEITGWNSGGDINPAKLAVGDVLCYTFTSAGSANSQVLIKGSDWSNLLGTAKIATADMGQTEVYVGVTEQMLATCGGKIFLQGDGGCVLTKIAKTDKTFNATGVLAYGERIPGTEIYTTIPEDAKALAVTFVEAPEWAQVCNSSWADLELAGESVTNDDNTVTITYALTESAISAINDKKTVIINSGTNVISVKAVSGTVGIDNVAIDENAPVEYYNLQGVKVANPANGIYVVRQGNKVSKVLVK
ncbi:MAG: hypothetical protein K2G47_00085 [Muribaculum sp.]|nr:hypothetical protein [Muribaculum sp.]